MIGNRQRGQNTGGCKQENGGQGRGPDASAVMPLMTEGLGA
jgi:hypothetical protein